MKLLALETSTETLSLAVQNGAQQWLHSGPGGALASQTVIAALRALMAQAGLAFAELDAVLFGSGPGAFTGLRTACSVAQGLAFGAGVPVLPVPSLLALAEQARWQQPQPEAARVVLAAVDARIDELYAECYIFNSGLWSLHADYGLIRPENLRCQPDWLLAGNAQAAYPGRVAPGQPGLLVLPSAAALLRLAPALLAAGRALPAAQALPRYVRDKVAQTTAERALGRALRDAAGT